MTAKEFEWDEANREKNWDKHKVSTKECEEVFFNTPFVVARDIKHSEIEERFIGLGKTNKRRQLHVVFTMRKGRIRVISARDQNVRERRRYEKENK